MTELTRKELLANLPKVGQKEADAIVAELWEAVHQASREWLAENAAPKLGRPKELPKREPKTPTFSRE